MTTFTLTGTFTHQDGVTPIVNSEIEVMAAPFPFGSMTQGGIQAKKTNGNGQVTFTLTTGVTGLYYVITSLAKNPLISPNPTRFLAPSAGTTLDIKTLTFYNPGDPPVLAQVLTVLDEVDTARDAAIAAASAVAIGTWQALTPVVSGQTEQAPDGSLIKSDASRTTLSTFTADYATGHWTPVSTKSGTVEKTALDALYGKLGSDNTFHGANHFSGQATFSNPSNVRQPLASDQIIDANAAGTNDLIAHSFSTHITGDFSVATILPDPTRGWGLDVFTITGTGALDGNGGHIANLIEAFAQASGGTILEVHGLDIGVGLWGAGVGVHVNDMTTLRLNGPARFVGATGGSVGTVQTLYVAEPEIVGDSTTFSVLVAGSQRIAASNPAKSPLTVVAAASPSVDIFNISTTGSTAKMWVPSDSSVRTTASVRVRDSTGATDLAGIDHAGLHYYSSTNEQTTVGATGAASALPGLPVKYLKITDSTGAVLVIPAYNH